MHKFYTKSLLSRGSMLKKIKFGSLFFSILVPLVIGSATSLVVNKFSSFDPYAYMPSFTPPAIVFIVVWSVLYVLMGVSNYIINNHSDVSEEELRQANSTYVYSLVVNVVYSLCFFIFKWTLLSFFICLYLAIVVLQTICQYFHIRKIAAYLQIPYALWASFASILTFMVWWLNW